MDFSFCVGVLGGKFYTDSQRKEVLDLFKQGQAVYKAMM